MGLDYATLLGLARDDLLLDATAGQEAIIRWWREHRRIPPSAILWPRKPVLHDGGNVVGGKFALNLPEDPAVWKDLIWKAAEQIGAYAIMLTYQRSTEVRSILENKFGTLSWRYPIVEHGPDRVLGKPIFEKDEHHVGLFWPPSSRPLPEAPQ